MIITRTPLRVSFVGGGSDIESHYLEHSGSVISTAINQYVYITIKNKFDRGIRFSYSKTENRAALKDIKHNLCREILKKFYPPKGLEIVSISDIPSKGTVYEGLIAPGTLRGRFRFPIWVLGRGSRFKQVSFGAPSSLGS